MQVHMPQQVEVKLDSSLSQVGECVLQSYGFPDRTEVTSKSLSIIVFSISSFKGPEISDTGCTSVTY